MLRTLRFLAAGGALLTFAVCGLAAPEQSCAPRNLVADARFRTLANAEGRGRWQGRQHASSGSFVARAENGELEIEKVGDEPWFVLSQNIRNRQLGGATVRFSALLKFEITEPVPPHGFDPVAGLYFAARNHSRRRILLSEADHDPNGGSTEWVRVAQEFELPPNTASLEVGFTHQAGGTLRAMNPQLHLLGQPCGG